MHPFYNIKELLTTLGWSKDLLSEMFEKRKSFAYTYDQALEILEDNKLDALIEREVIRRNGNFLEIDDQFQQFFERILEVNEEINSSYINESIHQLKQHINYYLQENNESRKYGYLKYVKSALRKIGRTTIRNIVDLTRNIENLLISLKKKLSLFVLSKTVPVTVRFGGYTLNIALGSQKN